MARRRINTKFVLLTAAMAGVLGAGGFVAYKLHKPRNPQPFIMDGDKSMQAQDYPKAVEDYTIASSLIPQEISLHLKLAQAYFQMRDVSADNFMSAVSEYTKAEELNPRSVEAWSGLLEANDLRVEAWETRPGDSRDRQQLPAAINMEREAAEHLFALDPTNIDAQAAGPILVIRVWLLNLPIPQTNAERDLPLEKQLTPDQKAEQAVADLTKLKADHPENEKIPYWIARAKMYQGQLALRGERPGDAAPLFAEAADEFEPCIAARPTSVQLYLGKASILEQLTTIDPSPETGQDYRAKKRDALDKAQANADPKFPMFYQRAKTQWARSLSQTDPGRAEAAYKDLITRYPNDLSIRLEFAGVLKHQSTRRADALALLDGISTLRPPPVTNVQARSNWDTMISLSKLVRADILNDELAVTPPGSVRDNLVKEIQDSLSAAQLRLDGTAKLLRVRGRFQLINGQTVDAIQTLTQAVDKVTSESGAVDYDLLHDEVNAYRQGQQTGKAIELLEKAMANPAVANNAEVHSMLAEMYLQNQDYARAKPNVEWLAIRYPTNSQILALQIAAQGPNGDPDVIKKLFDQLPETTPAEIASKYSIARQIKDQVEAIRLLKMLNQANPGEIDVASQLAQMLYQTNHLAEANDVIDAAQKKNPGDMSLGVVRKAINGASRDDVQNLEYNAIMSIKDPFLRQTKLAQLYQAEQRPADEMVALQEARKLQPNNIQVLQTIFIRYMDAHQFALAEEMLPHLAEIDADNAHGLMLKCKLQLAKKDVPNALLTGRQLTHDFPQFSGSWELYGEALRDSGQFDAACQQFSTALDMQATNIEATQNLIQCSITLGKLDDAKNYISKAIERFPDNPAYREMRVKFEINYGDPESVLPELTDALKQHPENVQNYGVLGEALVAAIRGAVSKGDPDSSAQYLERLKTTLEQGLQLAPDNLGFANSLAAALAQGKDTAGAEKVLKTISERPHWKNQPAPLILLGHLYLSEQKPNLAEAALRAALSADKRSVDARTTLADALVVEQKYDDALAILQPAADDFTIRSKYTDLLLAMNRGAQAEVGVSDAISADPTNSSLKNLLIHVYDAEGKHDKALKAANDALLADHTDTPAYYWLAKLESGNAKPDYDQAIKNLSFFRDFAPNDADGRVLMAQLLDAKQDRDGAIHELELASRFVPQDRRIRKMLLRDYLSSTPPRIGDAEHFMQQTLAMPAFQHDPDFEALTALVLAQKGDNDKAIAAIQDAMNHTSDKPSLMGDYFRVLLTTKNYDLLMEESDKYITDPKTGWFVFSARAQAEIARGDLDGATNDFSTALDRAGIEKGRDAAEGIAFTIRDAAWSTTDDKAGQAKALSLILPRAQNSVSWKVIAIDLYIADKDLAAGVKMVEPTLLGMDALVPDDQFHVLQQASSLYLTVNPPMAQQAIKIYQRMLAINPDDIEAMNDMACILSDMVVPAKPQEALNWSRKAFEISKDSGHLNARVYDTHGWVLILNGNIDEGIDVLHQAVDASDFPDAHYHLAKGYMAKQQPEYAQPELTKAMDMIQQKIDAHQIVDLALKTKVEIASKEADEMVRVKNGGKTAS